MYKLVFSSRAESEFLEAYHWYDDQAFGISKKFQHIIDHHLQLIREHPFLFQEKKGGYRECALPVFPFVIVYKCYPENEEILILSVFHTSQNPKDKI